MSSVLRTTPPPCQPSLPLAGSSLPCAFRSTDRASRVAASFILHACQGQYPGGNCPVLLSFSSQTTGGLLLFHGGSAPTLLVSRPAQPSLHVPACMLAESPMRSFYPKCFNSFRCLHKSLWSLLTGTTVVRWVSHPPERSAFPRCTRKNKLSGQSVHSASVCSIYCGLMV